VAENFAGVAAVRTICGYHGRPPHRYTDRIKGVVGCYERVVIHGTLPGICYAAGMTSLLKSRDIRVFDYTK